MSSTRHNYRPVNWNHLDAFANRMNRIFGDAGLGNLTHGAEWVPPVSVKERSGEILLTAELPGMTEDQVEISLENNVLSVSGEKLEELETREDGDADGKFHLVERTFGSFRRSFMLPRTIQPEGITAEFDNGLLTVRLPKADEALSRKIEVSRRA